MAQRRGHAAGHALQRQRDHRAAGPEHVAARRVRVAQGRVQEHVRDARPPDVQLRDTQYLNQYMSIMTLQCSITLRVYKAAMQKKCAEVRTKW